MVARVRTVAFQGIEATEVEAQMTVAAGLPAFTVAGRPDKAVGSRQNEDARILRCFDGGTDFRAGFFAWKTRLPSRGERARRHLVLDQNCGGARASEDAHGSLHIHGIAKTMIAIGEDQGLRRRTVHHVE